MDNPDVLFQILARVDHKTLIDFCSSELWVLARDVASRWIFWKLRAEFAVGKALADRRGADWRHIYSVLVLGKRVHTQLSPIATWPTILPDSVSWVYEYALDDLATMKATIEAYGSPDWKEMYADIIWDAVPSMEVLMYLIEEHRLPLNRCVAGIVPAIEKNRQDIVEYILPFVKDNDYIGYAAGAAISWGRIEVFALLLPRIHPQQKKNLLSESVRLGSTGIVRLLLEDGSVGKAGIPMLRKSINQGHIELTSYLLTLVNPAKKSEALLSLALNRGREMFRVVLQDRRIDPTSFAIAISTSGANRMPQVVSMLLQDSKLRVSELSSDCLAALMRSGLMIDIERRDGLKCWQDSKGDGACDELFLFLMNRVRSPQQVLRWITERKDNTLVASALTSLKEETLPSVEEAEPLRALMLALVYPEETIEGHIDLLREEGTSDKNLVLSVRLLTAYLA